MSNGKVVENSVTHKWFRLKQLLLDRIRRNDYEPDAVFCTQEELMAEHDVSYATVSRALSELVREGYLSRKRGVGTFVMSENGRANVVEAIGLLVWERDAVTHPAFSRLVAGLSEALRKAGQNLSFVFADAEQCRQGRLATVIRQSKISALVAPAQPMLTEDSLRAAAEAGIPIVPLNLDCPHLTPCAIHFDTAGAARTATSHLIGCGYRTVLLMLPDDHPGLKRTAGYQAALREAGVHEQLILTESPNRSAAADVLRILDRLEAPVGVVARDDLSALAVLRAASQAGWDVPGKLGVVGQGNFVSPEAADRALTTVHVPFDTMGQLAAEMALTLLAGDTPDQPVRRLPAKLIPRDTTARLREAGPALLRHHKHSVQQKEY